MVLLRYMSERQKMEVAICTFESIQRASDWMRKYATEHDLPALAASTEDVYKGAVETIDVLKDIKELLYPDEPKTGKVVHLFTKEVIR